MMLSLAIVLVIVPAIEMLCPIFSRCEQEDEFFPGWSSIFQKAPFNTPSPSSPPDSGNVFKDIVGLIPKKTPSTPGELEDFFKDLQGVFQNSPSTTPLKSGEYLREGQCQYTCTETGYGGCSAQLVVDWANVTENWAEVTYSECASSLNKGKCRERITGCNDCNKVIDCEKERAPENGVEKLIASTCRSSLSFDGEEVTVTCLKSCPGDDLQDDCKCGTKVYKQGRAISEEELYKYGVGSLGTYDCAFAAIGTPLAELTALAGTANFPTNFGPTTRDSVACPTTQCRSKRENKCCDVVLRGGASICPYNC